MRWLPEEDMLLQELVSKGIGYKYIAITLEKTFNRVFTKNAIVGRTDRLKHGIKNCKANHKCLTHSTAKK